MSKKKVRRIYLHKDVIFAGLTIEGAAEAMAEVYMAALRIQRDTTLFGDFKNTKIQIVAYFSGVELIYDTNHDQNSIIEQYYEK